MKRIKKIAGETEGKGPNSGPPSQTPEETTTNSVLKELAKEVENIGIYRDEKQLFIIPTALQSFNRASGVGGLPCGCIIDLHGPSMGGKTALGMILLASAQKAGHFIGIADAEGSFKDKRWPLAFGLDFNNLVYIDSEIKDKKGKLRNRTYEEVATIINKTLISFKEKQRINKQLENKSFIWLLDSLPALVPAAEMEGDLGKANFGLHANLTSRWLKMLNSILLGTAHNVIIINQERINMGHKPFQKEWKTTSGEALKYYAHFRVRVLGTTKIYKGEKDDKTFIGREHKFIVEKNKVSGTDEIGFFYTGLGKDSSLPLGWNLEKSLFKEAMLLEIIRKEGRDLIHNYEDGTLRMDEELFCELAKNNKQFQQWLNTEFEKRKGINYGEFPEEEDTDNPESVE